MMYEEENIEPDFINRLKKNPYKTPENYFDTIEDRIMERIKQEKKELTITKTEKAIRLLKPILALAASFALIFLLVYYPITYFSRKEIAKTNIPETSSTEVMDMYSLTIALADENSLMNTLINEENTNKEEINSDEVLAYLSSNMNDIEIYAEIQK